MIARPEGPAGRRRRPPRPAAPRRGRGAGPSCPRARSGVAYRSIGASPTPAGARGTGLRGRLAAADRMNLTWLMPAKGGHMAASRKAYVAGPRPGIRVPVREITLAGGQPPVRLYDTSGPATDPDARLDVKRGLPPLRLGWIRERGDVEGLAGPTY